MKQVININFQGRVVPIEQNAYEILKDYIQSLNNYFAAEEGKEEIVNDIENRIGELFDQKIKAGNSCITEVDVEAVINSIGRVEDFDDEGGKEETTREEASSSNGTSGIGYRKLLRDENNKVLGGVCSGVAHYLGIDITVARVIFAILFFSFGIGFLAYIILWVVVPSSATLQMGSKRKRLFRDKENGYVAGVCSGVAQYFHISVWIPRLIFLIPLIGFISRTLRWSSWGNMSDWDNWNNFNISYSPGLLITYIIAWLVIPEAKTTSEKLEMKGEKVDMNSIKKSVTDEIKGVQKRATKFANEAGTYATSKGTQMANEVTRAAKNKSGFSELVSLIVKIITYFILGSILISFLVGLIFLAVVSIGIFPLKDFVISGTNQNLYAWGTLILFIAVPVIGIIVYVIRRITKVKTGTKYIAPTFSGLWALGWVSIILLVSSVSKDFRKANMPQPENIVLNNPSTQKLILSSSYNENQFRLPETLNFTPFDWIDEDTAIAKNITINIFKSPTDSFRVVMYKSARGATRDIAAANAAKIEFYAYQKDSLLVMNEGISINKTDKFRNQEVIINVYVPLGKSIRIDENTRRNNNVRLDFGNSNNDDRTYNNAFYGWKINTDYTMMADGLHSEDGDIFVEGKWGSVRNESDDEDSASGSNTIDKNGINVKGDDGTEVIINENGIKVTDENGKDKVLIGNPETKDAIEKTREAEQKLKAEKKKIEDSLRKSMEETQRKLDKLKDNALNQNTAQPFVIASYNPGMLLSVYL